MRVGKLEVLMHLAAFALIGTNLSSTTLVNFPPEASTSVTRGFRKNSLQGLEDRGEEHSTGSINISRVQLSSSFRTEDETGKPNLTGTVPKVSAHTKPTEAEDLQNGLGKTDKEGIVTQNSMQKSGKSKKRRKKKIPVLKQASEENYLHPLKKDVIEIQKSTTSKSDSNPSKKKNKNHFAGVDQEETNGDLAMSQLRLHDSHITREYGITASASDLINCILDDERQVLQIMQQKGISRIKMAFQPFQPSNPGEIYPGVIKGMWSDVVHQSQPLLQDIVNFLQNETWQGGISQAKTNSALQDECSQLAFKLFATHLQLSNSQNHLPLHQLKNENYIAMKFLWNLNPDLIVLTLQKCSMVHPEISQYEMHRRIITFTNQIVQKTSVENWKMIKQSLIDRKEYNLSFLNKVEDCFQLNHEFPEKRIGEDVKTSEEYQGKTSHKDTYNTAIDIAQKTLGDFEWHRRTQVAEDIIKFPPKWTLSLELWEELREAERYNGVNVWNVFHFIHYLGLGKENKIESWSISKVIRHIEILNMVSSGTNWQADIGWSESADRAWMRKVFKEEYDQKLNSLVERGKRITWKYLEMPSLARKEFEAETNVNRKIFDLVQFREEEILRLADHGVCDEILVLIKLLRDQNRQQDGHIKWESVWNQFPPELELATDVKKFAQSWINENFP
ncbi:hypothetical protein PGTUg99_012965 [Puccinia graminis f. sp. tritici]|uniref:Uncharacterized protein n=1 Tax=Puccinia graminis f. sp. tritici TaxID=56615 RepID=A0A5B0M8N8_PUCGR|nr:hypothetical protein PGTUg99_012965 [Puccinia graminis f. sp. tritici]